MVCTSNCSLVVMLPPTSNESGFRAGDCNEDSDSVLEVTEPPAVTVMDASRSTPVIVDGLVTNATFEAAPGLLAIELSAMMLGVLMYPARARSARMRSTAVRSAASAED